MAESKKPFKNAGVFDVSHPGKGSSASATSKHVIISNRPVIKDNTVTDGTSSDRDTAPVLNHPKKVVITPLNEAVSTVTITPPPALPIAEGESVTVTVKTTTDSTPAMADVTPAADEKPTEELAIAVPTTDREDKQLSPMQADEALKLSQERAAKLQHMIENEQYFLPINAVEQRRSRRFAVLGLLLVILLAAAWYDSALDAGLVPNTFGLPHTSFFSIK